MIDEDEFELDMNIINVKMDGNDIKNEIKQNIIKN
jgi:hypothetical protein